MMRVEEQIENYLETYKSEITENLMKLVRISSLRSEPEEGAPFGSEVRKCLDAAGEMMKAHGFDMKIGGGGAFGICDYGDGEKTIGIFPHLDIVPVGDGWSGAPFEPYIENGFMIGRGVSDDKAGAIMAMYAMNALKELNIPMNCKVRLVFGCNEETGMEDIKLFKKEYPVPDFSLVPDAFFPAGVGEKGRILLDVSMKEPFCGIKSIKGGAFNGSSVPEYAECSLPDQQTIWEELTVCAKENERLSLARKDGMIKLSAKGIGAHPAMPWDSVNAIGELMKALISISSMEEHDLELCRSIEAMVRGCDGAGLGIAYEDGISTPLTSVCMAIEMDESGRLKLRFNIRTCVTLEENDLRMKIESSVSEAGGYIINMLVSPSHYVSPENEYVKRVSQIYNQVTGAQEPCYVHPGGTYAGKLGEAIIYGNEFRKEIPFPNGKGRAHQADEATSMEDLMNGIKIYIYTLMELGKEL